MKKFKAYVEAAGPTPEAWTAQLQIGDILFSKLGAYDEAIHHYRALLQKKPDSPDAPEILFRTGRSHFFLWEFTEAVQIFRELGQKYPQSKWAERASYEIALSLYTSGEQQPDDRGPGMDVYRKAMKAYEEFIQHYPASTLVPEAKFGVANCLEELDQLEAAYEKYAELKKTYPSPKIIEVKLARLRERQLERKR
jgi:TolA-binding protein